MVLPTAAAVRQSCSVVLSWYVWYDIIYEVHHPEPKYKDRLISKMICKRSVRLRRHVT